MALEWSDDLYSTGYGEIDNDHRKVFGILNDLLESLRTKGFNSTMADSLTLLEKLTIEHFRKEEKLMEETQCIVCDQNRRAHLQFEKKLRTYLGGFQRDADNRESLMGFLDFTAGWFTDHIQKADIHLRSTKLQ